jgi:transforming growth factor-beta-induced protein
MNELDVYSSNEENTMTRTKSFAAFAFTVFALGCSSEDEPSGSPSDTKATLTNVARESGNFTTLVGALEATGLDVALEGPGPFTVMAPTDAAFARLPDGVVASLDAATLEKILKYHVISGKALAADIVTMTSATTLEGDGFSISAGPDGVFLNAATEVVQTDVMADNGVIHVLDSVLLPPDIAFPGTLVDAVSAYPAFDTLVGAVVRAELAGALEGENDGKGLTLFAPTNAAFDALGVELSTLETSALSNVLLYHVVGDTVDASTVVGLTSAPTLEGSSVAISIAGGGVTLDGDVNVIRTDLRASNGIIHVVDGVLTPEN